MLSTYLCRIFTIDGKSLHDGMQLRFDQENILKEKIHQLLPQTSYWRLPFAFLKWIPSATGGWTWVDSCYKEKKIWKEILSGWGLPSYFYKPIIGRKTSLKQNMKSNSSWLGQAAIRNASSVGEQAAMHQRPTGCASDVFVYLYLYVFVNLYLYLHQPHMYSQERRIPQDWHDICM